MEYVSIQAISLFSRVPIVTINDLLSREEYQKYCIVEGDTLKVSVDFLDVLERIKQAAPEQQQEKQAAPEQEQEKQAAPEQEQEQKETESPAEEIKRLRQEVQELKYTISRKDRQIAEYASRFAELASQAQGIATRTQILMLAELRDIPSLDTTQTKAAPASPQEPPQEPPRKKKGFFKRLFENW